jgi:hypothetical protein
MTVYRMRKPAWFGSVGEATVVSPASVVEVADWWDAWRLMWWAIGAAADQSAVMWTRLT